MAERADGSSESTAPIREEMVFLLTRGNAHMGFEDAVADFPEEAMNTPFPNGTYTPWHLLEHMRLTQWDILEFSRDAKHKSPDWPGGYWPTKAAPPDEKAWDKSVRAFRRDLNALSALVADESTDLFAPIPHGTGQTILREALLAADHNAYHLGQLLLLRRLLGAWK